MSNYLGGLFGDVSSRSAYTQLMIGVSSGWLTGFTTMKFGKVAAFAIGGGLILMEIAQQEKIINIKWSKISRTIDKVADQVETTVTGNEKNWMDKATKMFDANRRVSVAFIGGVFLGLSCA